MLGLYIKWHIIVNKLHHDLYIVNMHIKAVEVVKNKELESFSSDVEYAFEKQNMLLLLLSNHEKQKS